MHFIDFYLLKQEDTYLNTLVYTEIKCTADFKQVSPKKKL